MAKSQALPRKSLNAVEALLQKLETARFAVTEAGWALGAEGIEDRPGELPYCELDDIILNVEGLRDRTRAQGASS